MPIEIPDKTDIWQRKTMFDFWGDAGATESKFNKDKYKGALAFNAGFGYWVYTKPYDHSTREFFRADKLPAGIIPVKGGYNSIQQFIDDKQYTTFSDRIGFINVTVNEPDRMPGKAGAITYTSSQNANTAKEDIELPIIALPSVDSTSTASSDDFRVHDIKLEPVDLSDLGFDEKPQLVTPIKVTERDYRIPPPAQNRIYPKRSNSNARPELR